MNFSYVAIGRAALAQAMAAKPITLAIGRGDGVWSDMPPPLNGTETALQDPFAMVRASGVLYCDPVADTSGLSAGELEAMGAEPDVNGYFKDKNNAVWQIVDGPTMYLYCMFILSQTAAHGEVMREFAVYIDTVFAAEVPPGQLYNDWGQLVSPGTPLLMANEPANLRDGAREAIGIIIKF